MAKEVSIVVSRRIVVDSGIADEIYWLNERGIITEGSCSGHGKGTSTAMIRLSSVDTAREMGYDPKYCKSGLFEIQLHGPINQDYILHETGKQPYSNCIFSAGVCEGHKFDSVYLNLERTGEAPTTIFLRRDEALAIIRGLVV